MSSHTRFDSDEDEAKKVKVAEDADERKQKKEKKKRHRDEEGEEEIAKKEKKEKKKKRKNEEVSDEESRDKRKKERNDDDSVEKRSERKKDKEQEESSEERFKEKKKDRKRDEEKPSKNDHFGDRGDWRKKDDWNNRSDNRGGQWRGGQRDRERYDRGDWNRSDNRNWKDRRDNKKPDPRDNDPTKPAWATGAVLDRANELKQRQLLWKKPVEGEEGSSNAEDKHVEKNAGMWSVAFTAAAGGNAAQSSKFMKLLGIKNAPTTSEADQAKVKEEAKKQQELIAGLQKQYEVSREFSHQGRGKGLGFGGF